MRSGSSAATTRISADAIHRLRQSSESEGSVQAQDTHLNKQQRDQSEPQPQEPSSGDIYLRRTMTFQSGPSANTEVGGGLGVILQSVTRGQTDVRHANSTSSAAQRGIVSTNKKLLLSQLGEQETQISRRRHLAPFLQTFLALYIGSNVFGGRSIGNLELYQLVVAQWG